MKYTINKGLILENVFRGEKLQDNALRNTLVNNSTTGLPNNLSIVGHGGVPLAGNVAGVLANKGNGHGVVGAVHGTRGVLGANSNNVKGISLKDAYSNNYGLKTAGAAALGALGMHVTGLDDNISDFIVDKSVEHTPGGDQLDDDDISKMKEKFYKKHDDKLAGTTLMSAAIGAAAPAAMYGAGKLFGSRQNYRNVK